MPHNIVEEDVESVLKLVDLSWFKDKKVLITGASGMIGYYLLECLTAAINKGCGPNEIWVVSKTGIFPDKISKDIQIKISNIDLCDGQSINKLPNFDAIFHAGGYAQPVIFLADPLATISVNTTATILLIKKLNPGGKFLYFSSSEIYSGSTATPFREDDIGRTNTNHPRSAYIEGKRCGEAIVNSARKQLGIDATSIRVSLVYGPGTKSKDKRVLCQIIDQAIESQKIRLLDSGNAVRTYCYVSDAVRLAFVAMLRGTESVYNVGGISKISISGLAEMIAEITNSKVTVGESPNLLKGAPDDVKLDLTKILKLANNENFINLRTGLTRTIHWIQSIIEQNRKLDMK
jgi:nucleoside-diphosphate-sugar epimerase